MLSVQMEQRVNHKFLVKLGKTFTEAYAMLKEVRVYGASTGTRAGVTSNKTACSLFANSDPKTTDGDQVLCETGEECCGNHSKKKAFGVDCLSERQIFRWHKAFAEGREGVNDENRAGRPSTSSTDDNVKRMHDLLNTDRRLSVRLTSETLDIMKTIVHEIVSESLGMRKVCSKLVPKVPEERKQVAGCLVEPPLLGCWHGIT
ncbi:hypothetical protein NQ318_001232 [Aromia moschata]|uniref:Mos1 transposase HTH domain-containing protein n=1 Tax=Aromia moschata TaxID=1265417 RepID=A0AAV8ZHG1_9CUCU|nr:hypothetical protein NQ318_001232 [Aromia moschata]